MAGIGDYFDELGDIFAGIFTRKTEEERAYPISVRKQREILNAVGGDENKANLIKNTMCTIGFDTISDNETWKAVYNFYKSLEWDQERVSYYLYRFVLLRDAISNSKKQQFSRLNKNRKVDNVAILEQTVGLLKSKLDEDEIEMIIQACTLTGVEISEARDIWESEKNRALEEDYDEEKSLEEAKYFFNKIVNLTRLTTNTTLSDARDIIGRGEFEKTPNSFIDKIRELLSSVLSKKSKKSEENEIQESKVTENELIRGLDYNKPLIEELELAITIGKKTNKQVYDRTLKSIYEEFDKTSNHNALVFSTNEHGKRTRKKATAYFAIAGIITAKVLSMIFGSKVEEPKEDPQATESVVEDTESIPSDSESISTESGITPTAANAATAFRKSNISELTIGNDNATIDLKDGKITYQITAKEDEENIV